MVGVTIRAKQVDRPGWRDGIGKIVNFRAGRSGLNEDSNRAEAGCPEQNIFSRSNMIHERGNTWRLGAPQCTAQCAGTGSTRDRTGAGKRCQRHRPLRLRRGEENKTEGPRRPAIDDQLGTPCATIQAVFVPWRACQRASAGLAIMNVQQRKMRRAARTLELDPARPDS